MFDNSQAGKDGRVRLWLIQRPKLTLGMICALVVVGTVLFLASAHRPGMPIITPGKKAATLTELLFGETPVFQAPGPRPTPPAGRPRPTADRRGPRPPPRSGRPG